MLAAALPDRRIRRPPGSLILTRYGLRVPDPLKLRRWSRPACATTATGWKATRWSIDRRVQQLIAGQQRPVPGTGPTASRCCPRPPAQPGRRKPISTCRGTVRPGLPGREPRAWVSRPAGRSRAPDTRCTPGHQSFQVFPLSTQYRQNAGSYPHLAAVIHWFIHSRPQVTGCNSGNTAAAVAACNQLILSWRLPGYPLVPALDHGTHA
jgi:hypothetical protein